MIAVAELFAYPFAKIYVGYDAKLMELYVGYDAKLMELTVYGFRILALSFCFMEFAIFASRFFTALND